MTSEVICKRGTCFDLDSEMYRMRSMVKEDEFQDEIELELIHQQL